MNLLPCLAENDMKTQVAMRVPGNYPANLKLAYILRLQGKYKKATATVERMLTLYPDDISFLTELGILKSLQGQRDAAKRIYNQVLLLSPNNVTVKQLLSKL